jgi:hypothetical protein
VKPLRRLGAVLLGAPLLAAAQSPIIEPSIALDCLKPARERRGTPEYPFDAWKRSLGGRVEVELSFSAPDRAPAVKVLTNEGDDSFVEAVRSHVRQFRLPCVDSGISRGRLVLDYRFQPDDRKVAVADPTDPDHEARRKQLACLRHTSGQKGPRYPPLALRNGIQGRLHIELQFDAAGTPPKFQVYSATGRGPLHKAMEDWLPEYRLPCFVGPEPVKTSLQYVYMFEGSGNYGFKPMEFVQFLSAIKGIRQQTIGFDFNQMGCPFDVRLTYLQPHRANKVGQLGNHDPARLPFLDWLQKVQLDLPSKLLESVYADSTTLTIPCTHLNLNPQE